MEALNDLVKAGKVRALGASAMYGYQFYNMQLAAKEHGWARFAAMEVTLSPEDISYLEEPYIPHRIVGAIDHNPADGVMLLDEKKQVVWHFA